jgi:DNA polymerase-3 subunit delta'
MSWKKIIGQERVKGLLQKALSSEQIAHAYLFFGPEGIGKDALVLEFAKTLSCTTKNTEACDSCNSCKQFDALQHPNINLIFPLPVGKNEKTGDDPFIGLSDAQMGDIRHQIAQKAHDPYYQIEIEKANFIKINSVRSVKREASMSTLEAGRKIFLIFNADQMNAEASNSLLKTLEEPLPGTMLLLTTSSKDQLLPTIISRCQEIRCDLLKEEEIESALIERDRIDPSTARIAAEMSNGSYAAARRLLSQSIMEERKEIVDFLRMVLSKQRSPLIEHLEELASPADRIAIERWLKLLQTWLRDAMLMQKNGSVRILEEEKQSMSNFISKFPQANLSEALKTTEKAIAHLNKNIYLPLVLTTMTLELRKNIAES